MHRGARKRTGKQRNQARFAFENHAGFRARDQIGNDACEHDLIADALLGRHQDALARQRAAVPMLETVIGRRHLAGKLEARGIIAPARFQIAFEKMQDRAIEPRLGILRIGLQGAIVERKGLVDLALVGQKIGKIDERGKIAGLKIERATQMQDGLFALAGFA